MNELDGMKLILVSPTYGPTDPRCNQELRGAIMTTAHHGVNWIGDASADRLTYGHARNVGAQALINVPEATGIMWVDSDIRQEPGDMLRLLMSAKRFDAEFVTGVYHQRRPPYDAVFYQWLPNRELFAAPLEYPELSFEPVDGCGFGFVYTSRKVIEAVASSPKFNSDQGWFPDRRDVDGWGEDLSFCHQVKFNTDIQLYVDTGVIVGHLGDPEVIYPGKRKEVKKAMAATVIADAKDSKQWGIK